MEEEINIEPNNVIVKENDISLLEKNNIISLNEDNVNINITPSEIYVYKDNLIIDDSLEGEGTEINPLGLSNKSKTKYESFTLDILDLNNKYITIQGIINDNQSIRLFADNIGIKLEQGVDYSVSGNQVFWSGYALENLLEVGDTLQIFYI